MSRQLADLWDFFPLKFPVLWDLCGRILWFLFYFISADFQFHGWNGKMGVLFPLSSKNFEQHGLEIRKWINPSTKWYGPHKPAHHPLSVKPDDTSATEAKRALNPHLSTSQLRQADKEPWEESVGSPPVSPSPSVLCKTSKELAKELLGRPLSTGPLLRYEH